MKNRKGEWVEVNDKTGWTEKTFASNEDAWRDRDRRVGEATRPEQQRHERGRK